MYGFVSDRLVSSRGYEALGRYAQRSSASSTEAQVARDIGSDLVSKAEDSVALFGDQKVARSALHAVVNECSEDDWDASGARAVVPAAAQTALRLIQALPSGVPMPECSAEPDGSISLDWSESRYRVFSISVSSSDRLAFAWLDGSDKGHGVARFDGRVVPDRVLLLIRDTFGQPHASLRAS